MFERFSRSARAAVEDAVYEAGRRGDRRIGTEHLLLALLADDELAKIVGVDASAAFVKRAVPNATLPELAPGATTFLAPSANEVTGI